MYVQPAAVASAFIGGAETTFIGDTVHDEVWSVSDATGSSVVVAGDGVAGYSGDGGTASLARLDAPSGLAVDSSGDLYIADAVASVVRFVPATSGTYFGKSMTAGDIYTVAGDGTAGFMGDNALATSAELNVPQGIAVDSAGDLVIADTQNTRVRFVPATSGTYFGLSMTAGYIYTVAGGALPPGNSEGVAPTSATLYYPDAVQFDGQDDLFIANTQASTVREIPATSGTFYGIPMNAGDIYTIAGDGRFGDTGDGGGATSADLNLPTALAIDGAGNVAIDDSDSAVIRYVPAASGTYFGVPMVGGDIYSVAGNGTAGSTGDGGPAISAELGGVSDLTFDHAGDLLLADKPNQLVRLVADQTTTAFGVHILTGSIAPVVGGGSSKFGGDGGPATSARLYSPDAVLPDSHGNLYLSDTGNGRVRFVPATSGVYFGQAMTAGDIYTIAGNGSFGGTVVNGVNPTSASITPYDLALDTAGDLFVGVELDLIDFIPATSGTFWGRSMIAGELYTVAGTGTPGGTYVDGSRATDTPCCTDPVGVDAAGDVYVYGNSNVRMIPSSTEVVHGRLLVAGDVYNVAGGGSVVSSGVPAAGADLAGLAGVAVDSSGDLAIDSDNGYIGYVPASSGTYFGVAMTGGDYYKLSATLTTPEGVSFAPDGGLYVSEPLQGYVKWITLASGAEYTIAGSGGRTYTSDGPALSTQFNPTGDVAVDGSGNIFIADTVNDRIFEDSVSLASPTITSLSSATFTKGQSGSFAAAATGFPAPTWSVSSGLLPPGVTLSTAGSLSGMPTVSGAYSFTLAATNGVGSPASQSFALSVDAPPNISSCFGGPSFPQAFTVGQASSTTVKVCGFPLPSVSEVGALPPGISLLDNGDGTATFSGTPTVGSAGTYPITIDALNAAGSLSSPGWVLTVDEAPSVDPAVAVPRFVAGTAGSYALSVTGTPSPSLSVTSGFLPPGVSLAANGLLSGTPPVGSGGVYRFSVAASNIVGTSVAQAFSVEVDQSPALSPAVSLTEGLNTSFSYTVTATGEPSPSLQETGTLPSGVTYRDNDDGTATVSGVPSTSGAFSFSVIASNGIGTSSTEGITLVIPAAPSSGAGSSPGTGQGSGILSTIPTVTTPIGVSGIAATTLTNPTTPTRPTNLTDPPPLSISSANLTLISGSISIRFAAPKVATTGTAMLQTTQRVVETVHHKRLTVEKTVTLGLVSFALRAHQPGHFTLHLNAAGRAALSGANVRHPDWVTMKIATKSGKSKSVRVSIV